MKTNKIIILSIISVFLTSCFSENYRVITRVERNGSCRGEIYEISDSLISPRYHSSGWEILSQTDTVVQNYMFPKNKNSIKLGKKFKSVEELSADTTRQRYCLTPRESLKKSFRWFYTYYVFTAVYPEVTDKGRVPIEKYLNKEEQKFYLQGDISAYCGMTGYELKMVLEDIETKFMTWYFLTIYEESFAIIMHYADMELRSELYAVKDSLYSINEKQITESMSSPVMINEICEWLDKYFATNRFSEQYVEFGGEMDDMLSENSKETNELQKFNIQYELTLPGKLVATNANLQNDGNLVWKINMFKFLADDYMLTAESRTVNVWAFAVTLLLIVFSVVCFRKLI